MGYHDKLYSFDLTIMTWTLLLAAEDSDSPPMGRESHGFTSVGGKLYVHGGIGWKMGGNVNESKNLIGAESKGNDPRYKEIARLPSFGSVLVITTIPFYITFAHPYSAALPVSSMGLILSDLYAFDPGTKVWTLVSVATDSAPAPTARLHHGFTSEGGKLYVHGGMGKSGK